MTAGAATKSGESLARSPLHQRHVHAAARLVPFAGCELPLQFDGVHKEHHAVQRHAGVRRLVHLGLLEPRRGAGEFVAAAEFLNLSLPVRQQLEPLAADPAALRRSGADLPLQSLLLLMRDHLRRFGAFCGRRHAPA